MATAALSLSLADAEHDAVHALDWSAAKQPAVRRRPSIASPTGASIASPEAAAYVDEGENKMLPGATNYREEAPLTAATAPTVAAEAASASPPVTVGSTGQFEPLRGRWQYGQPVLARFRKTPYFYSGNIATYLGAGLFMVVFDDGALDYHIKREDIMVRIAKDVQAVAATTANDPNSTVTTGQSRTSSFSQDQRRGSTSSETAGTGSVNELAPPGQQLLVDFSVNPPRSVFLILAGPPDHLEVQTVNQDEQQGEMLHAESPVIQDETVFMKQLEGGVAFEEDSTQVSDSDDSSDDEDGSLMTPWQQMTQTFGMTKAAVRPRGARRSSISSVSQVERVSQHASVTSLLRPRTFKQFVTDYLARKRRVQPAALDASLLRSTTQRDHLTRMLMNLDDLLEIPSPVDMSTIAGSRVVYERGSDGVRAYGTVKSQLPTGEFAVMTEDEQMITVEALPAAKLDFLPSTRELETQVDSLAHAAKELFAGRTVQVTLYPGSRFSGNGLVTAERPADAPGDEPRFHVLLANRLRLLNVPAGKLVPLRERKRQRAMITDDHFLICAGKTKVFVGDQVFVKCVAECGDGSVEEKLGVLNGVYSNRTAAVDFADGSTGYEIAPNRIVKRKKPRASSTADELDVLRLKNAVLTQLRLRDGDGDALELELEEGYQVKADHPRKQTIESCLVIRTHMSGACDLRFSDGTIALEVFPSQMVLDQKRKASRRASRAAWEPGVGEYVLAWSSRFSRFCSAKVTARGESGWAVAFDYGERRANVSRDRLARLDDTDALPQMQKLTNFSFDTLGFELWPVAFAVGEAVLARVYGSATYFYGAVELVRDKERTCQVLFDSGERDAAVPFAHMFSVDARARFQARGGKMGSSSDGGSLAFRPDGANDSQVVAAAVAAAIGDTELPVQRRKSTGEAVGQLFNSMAESLFGRRHDTDDTKTRRSSMLQTENGARVKRRQSGVVKDSAG